MYPKERIIHFKESLTFQSQQYCEYQIKKKISFIKMNESIKTKHQSFTQGFQLNFFFNYLEQYYNDLFEIMHYS